jgi:hypothetical protein
MEFNYEGVSAKRKEHKSLGVVGAVLGTVHLGLTMAADAVNSFEAALTEKITDGNIGYEEQKRYRQVTSHVKNEAIKTSMQETLNKLSKNKKPRLYIPHVRG